MEEVWASTRTEIDVHVEQWTHVISASAGIEGSQCEVDRMVGQD